ncbi:MAG: hypothetical protein KGI29_00810 [Pseudomonadota bacterium]|nr:hypothetical protein [Pseudomonadota bacterium]MDE3038151.1 hypothetical protein [Pseudomonadota bacterium]
MAKQHILQERESHIAAAQARAKQDEIREQKLDDLIRKDNEACIALAGPIAELIALEHNATSKSDFKPVELLHTYINDDKIALSVSHNGRHNDGQIGPESAKILLKRALPDCDAVAQLQLVPTEIPSSDQPNGRYLAPGYFVKHHGGFSIVADDAFAKVAQAAAVELQVRNICGKYARYSFDEFSAVLKESNFPEEVISRAIAFRTGASNSK